MLTAHEHDDDSLSLSLSLFLSFKLSHCVSVSLSVPYFFLCISLSFFARLCLFLFPKVSSFFSVVLSRADSAASHGNVRRKSKKNATLFLFLPCNMCLSFSLSLSSFFLFFSVSLSFPLSLFLFFCDMDPVPTLLPTKPIFSQCLLYPDSIDIFYTFSAWCDKTFVAVDAYRSSVPEESNRSNRLSRACLPFPLFLSFFSHLYLSFSFSSSFIGFESDSIA